MLPKILALEANPKDWRESLQCTFTKLYDGGFVKKSYLQNCVKREEQYPTALDFAMPVAIPHTEPEHVNVAAICILRLVTPVEFHSMEDPDEIKNVEFVFNLALKSSKDQLSVLQAIMKILGDEQWLYHAKHIPLEELAQAFTTQLEKCERN
ncbi:PTS sugar transporter subunit IIA [Lachnospiraceae bacterium ZAX-1]